MWWITFIDLCMVQHPCISGTDSTWLWCMIRLTAIKFSLLVFCWGFVHLYSSGILAYSFLSLQCLCLICLDLSRSGWPNFCRRVLPYVVFLVGSFFFFSEHIFLWIYHPIFFWPVRFLMRNLLVVLWSQWSHILSFYVISCFSLTAF